MKSRLCSGTSVVERDFSSTSHSMTSPCRDSGRGRATSQEQILMSQVEDLQAQRIANEQCGGELGRARLQEEREVESAQESRAR